MIPIHKLARLPRHQMLRKSSKIMAEADAEAALVEKRQGGVSYDRLRQVADVCSLMARDPGFDSIRQGALTAASVELMERASAAMRGEPVTFPRRPINVVRHILAGEIGETVADWDLVDNSGQLSKADRVSIRGIRIFLEDLRSPFNVGSVFRTAESFAVERIFVSPLCASPDHPRAARSAMGCTELVDWERADLADLDGPVFALETGGTSMDDFEFPGSGTMIIGSEELGVSPAALDLADRSLGRLSIPTWGAKGSLNVAVAFGIAMRAWASCLLSGNGDSRP